MREIRRSDTELYNSADLSAVADIEQLRQLAVFQQLAQYGSYHDAEIGGVPTRSYRVGWQANEGHAYEVVYTPQLGRTRLLTSGNYSLINYRRRQEAEELTFQEDGAGYGAGGKTDTTITWKASQGLYASKEAFVKWEASQLFNRYAQQGDDMPFEDGDLQAMCLHLSRRLNADEKIGDLLGRFTDSMPNMRRQRIKHAARQFGEAMLQAAASLSPVM